MGKELELRDMKVKDALRFGKLLAKLSEPQQDKIIEIIDTALESRDKDDEKGKKEIENEVGAEIVMVLFNNLMLYALDDLTEWMADIANMTKEEFEEAELELLIDFINQLVKKEDLESFFQRVLVTLSTVAAN